MYHYTESGLANVWLKNGYARKNTPYGEGVSIQDVEGLHKLIGALIAKRPKITGKELRFLRKEMEMSQSALAGLLGTSEQNISLWERRGNIPKVSDRLIKLILRVRWLHVVDVDADRLERSGGRVDSLVSFEGRDGRQNARV